MKYTFYNTEYEVEITDHQPFDGYNRRTFKLSHPIEAGYCFHVKYTLKNGLPKIHYVRSETGAFPEVEQAEVFSQAMIVEPLPFEN